MNATARQRALRAFLAALLQSDLTRSELNELADDLTLGAFGQELGYFLRTAMDQIETVKHSKDDLGRPDSDQRLAMDTIARRRMSKKVVQQLMILASPWIRPQQLTISGSVRELVDKYFNIAPTFETEKFLSILQGEPADAYTKGISRRER